MGLIGLRWLHYDEFRGAGPATTAPEEQGRQAWRGSSLSWWDVAATSVHNHIWLQGDGEMANAFRTVGRTAIIYKPTTTARLYVPQWHGVGQRR